MGIKLPPARRGEAPVSRQLTKEARKKSWETLAFVLGIKLSSGATQREMEEKLGTHITGRRTNIQSLAMSIEFLISTSGTAVGGEGASLPLGDQLVVGLH